MNYNNYDFTWFKILFFNPGTIVTLHNEQWLSSIALLFYLISCKKSRDFSSSHQTIWMKPSGDRKGTGIMIIPDNWVEPSLIARFIGPTWGPSRPTGPRWVSCWTHGLCYLACYQHCNHWIPDTGVCCNIFTEIINITKSESHIYRRLTIEVLRHTSNLNTSMHNWSFVGSLC